MPDGYLHFASVPLRSGFGPALASRIGGLPQLQRFKSHRRINSFHFEPDVASLEVALLSLDALSKDRLAAQDLLTSCITRRFRLEPLGIGWPPGNPLDLPSESVSLV